MENTLRRSLISAYFARQDTNDCFGPAGELHGEDRAWRHEHLDSAFKDFRDTRLMGVGADWREALEDAAQHGRIDLAEYGGDLTAAREAIGRGAIWEFIATPDGLALLDTGVGPAAI
ncbi:hypothetical protein ABT224_19805 [Streptomyces sp. NPDC001584]|uniref:hypothetical protein n=1 Tax=Streptomyces sp. NPDC001584 TaxID=3154521 RepID=UPI003317FE24